MLSQGKRLVKSVLIALNALVSVSLVGAAFAHSINPETWIVPAFLGLAFLPLLLLNALFLCFWLITRFKFGLISLAGILLSWGMINTHFNFSGNSTDQESDFSLISFNVRLFDLYNWRGNESTRNELLDFFQEKNADVLCLQEFFNSNDKSYFNTLDTLLEVQSATQVHTAYSAILHQGMSKFGIGTLSAYDIIDRGQISLDSSLHNLAIYTDIRFDSTIVRVYNLHLASVHITAMEKDIEEHITSNNSDEQLNDIKRIQGRLSSGFRRRASQAIAIKQHMNDSPYPIIACGDFNDTPSSFAYHHLAEGLTDCFNEMEFGVGSTYLGLIPGLRIDFILCSADIKVSTFETLDVELSDHRPVTIRFSINKQANSANS